MITPDEFQARMAPVWETCRRLDAEWAEGARKERPVMAGDIVTFGGAPLRVTAIDSTNGTALVRRPDATYRWAPLTELEVVR